MKKSTSEIILDINNLSYGYQSSQVLKDITFTVREGETIALLGANGSGKSTLLKILDALVFPSQGTYTAFSKLVSQQAFEDQNNEFEFRRRVGFVFQDSDVQLFSPTVWDEVLFGPLHLGIPKNEVIERAEWALKTMKIEKLKDRVPYQLSGGEQKKVAIASILSIRPRVWLFDEPTAGLDPRSQSILIDFMYEMKKNKATVITATHDLPILSEIADRVIVLSENHTIVADDTPENILQNEVFLLKHNLIHKHMHSHDDTTHQHTHTHVVNHQHKA